MSHEHKFKVREHIYTNSEHKFTDCKYKIKLVLKTNRIMANYILQELPEDLSDGKKVVFPKMQTYSLHDYETVLKHMRT